MTQLAARDQKYNNCLMEVTAKSDELDSLRTDIKFEEKRLYRTKVKTHLDPEPNEESEEELIELEMELVEAEQTAREVTVAYEKTQKSLENGDIQAFSTKIASLKERLLQFCQNNSEQEYLAKLSKRSAEQGDSLVEFKSMLKAIEKHSVEQTRQSIDSDEEAEEELIRKEKEAEVQETKQSVY